MLSRRRLVHLGTMLAPSILPSAPSCPPSRALSLSPFIVYRPRHGHDFELDLCRLYALILSTLSTTYDDVCFFVHGSYPPVSQMLIQHMVSNSDGSDRQLLASSLRSYFDMYVLYTVLLSTLAVMF